MILQQWINADKNNLKNIELGSEEYNHQVIKENFLKTFSVDKV